MHISEYWLRQRLWHDALEPGGKETCDSSGLREKFSVFHWVTNHFTEYICRYVSFNCLFPQLLISDLGEYATMLAQLFPYFSSVVRTCRSDVHSIHKTVTILGFIWRAQHEQSSTRGPLVRLSGDHLTCHSQAGGRREPTTTNTSVPLFH